MRSSLACFIVIPLCLFPSTAFKFRHAGLATTVKSKNNGATPFPRRHLNQSAYDMHSRYDARSNVAEYTQATSSSDPNFDWNLFSEAIAYEGRVYSAPHDNDGLLILDTQTNHAWAKSAAHLLTDLDLDMTLCFWLGITAYNGRIYAPPAVANQILVYDVGADSISGVDTSGVDTGSWNGIAESGGILYSAPLDAEVMLAYNPATNAVTGIPTSHLCKGPFKWMGAAVYSDKVYAAPLDLFGTCDQLLIYDTVTRRASGLSTAGLATGTWKWHGMGVLNGKIYAAPANIDTLLEYDPATMQLNGISTRGVETGEHKWAGLTSHNGKLYGGPMSSKQILVYDPDTRNVSGLSVLVDFHGYHGGNYPETNGIASWDGKLYCPPRNSSYVLVYSLPNEENPVKAAQAVDMVNISNMVRFW